MGRKEKELSPPQRKTFSGFSYWTGEHLRMTGKAWSELAQQKKFKWKRVGDPREGVHDLCGGGYEVHID